MVAKMHIGCGLNKGAKGVDEKRYRRGRKIRTQGTHTEEVSPNNVTLEYSPPPHRARERWGITFVEERGTMAKATVCLVYT